jgi:hypothetical protein
MSFKSLLFACVLTTAVSGAAVALAADATTPAKADAAKPAAKVKFVTPRTAWGAPDLENTWTNVTVTPLERATTYGTRKALTEDEVKVLEGKAEENVRYENSPTPTDVGSLDNTRKHCASADGRDCGYNAGWKDETVKVMRVHGEPRTSFITSTENGRIPPMIGGKADPQQAARLQREREQLAGEGGGGGRPGQNDNPEGRSLSERCISFGNTAGPMLPNGYYNNNIKIVQAKDSIAIDLEMVHDVRIIRLNQPHRTDGVKPYYGDSIGHWDGDTLVVETTNYHPATSFRGSDQNLVLTERFTRDAKDRLLYQFTVHDPSVWAADWSGEYEFYPTNGQLYEYACHEGNYGLEGILAGARAQEAEAKAKATGQPVAAR